MYGLASFLQSLSMHHYSLYALEDANLRLREWSRGAKNAQIYQKVALQKFVTRKKIDECLNCLDLPNLNLGGNQPSIISFVILSSSRL